MSDADLSLWIVAAVNGLIAGVNCYHAWSNARYAERNLANAKDNARNAATNVAHAEVNVRRAAEITAAWKRLAEMTTANWLVQKSLRCDGDERP